MARVLVMKQPPGVCEEDMEQVAVVQFLEGYPSAIWLLHSLDQIGLIGPPGRQGEPPPPSVVAVDEAPLWTSEQVVSTQSMLITQMTHSQVKAS
ncbi:hypothetical protein TREES_T100002472 [Tupaia chinensis]|uniref:Uncharacterized protein n=1 Tax=Tupaia chinensis TaxID=246437 RepID=L9L975_TUPCH|nr:hypothetical protein TREES_T100002472 [Tupaia chinensis]